MCCVVTVFFENEKKDNNNGYYLKPLILLYSLMFSFSGNTNIQRIRSQIAFENVRHVEE